MLLCDVRVSDMHIPRNPLERGLSDWYLQKGGKHMTSKIEPALEYQQNNSQAEEMVYSFAHSVYYESALEDEV